MVCAGMTSVASASVAALLSGCAVTSRTVAPASRATRIRVSTVVVSPGPELAKKTSPGPSGGMVMSPTTATGRPRWKSRIAKPFSCSASRPQPWTPMRPASGEQPAGGVDRPVVDLGQAPRRVRRTRSGRDCPAHRRSLWFRHQVPGLLVERLELPVLPRIDLRRAIRSGLMRRSSGFQVRISFFVTSPIASAARKASP